MMHAFAINPKRLAQLIRNELVHHRRIMLISAATILVLMALLSRFQSLSTGFFIFFLYSGGFLVTSYAFDDLCHERKSYLTLMLPCSVLERFLSKWLFTSVFYIVGLMGLCVIYELIMTLTHRSFTHLSGLLNPTQSSIGLHIINYFILQSLVLVGAVYFKRHVLLKTALSIGAFFLALGFLVSGIFYVFFPSYYLPDIVTFINLFFHKILVVFWMVGAPLCWAITFMRISQYQLK